MQEKPFSTKAAEPTKRIDQIELLELFQAEHDADTTLIMQFVERRFDDVRSGR